MPEETGMSLTQFSPLRMILFVLAGMALAAIIG